MIYTLTDCLYPIFFFVIQVIPTSIHTQLLLEPKSKGKNQKKKERQNHLTPATAVVRHRIHIISCETYQIIVCVPYYVICWFISASCCSILYSFYFVSLKHFTCCSTIRYFRFFFFGFCYTKIIEIGNDSIEMHRKNIMQNAIERFFEFFFFLLFLPRFYHFPFIVSWNVLMLEHHQWLIYYEIGSPNHQHPKFILFSFFKSFEILFSTQCFGDAGMQWVAMHVWNECITQCQVHKLAFYESYFTQNVDTVFNSSQFFFSTFYFSFFFGNAQRWKM